MSNESNNKRIAKNTLVLYMRSILMLGIGLLTSRYTLDALGVENFGVYNVVGGVVGMLSFLNASMSRASSRFITFALGRNDEKELKKVFSTSVTLHIVLAFIVLVLLEIAGIYMIYNQLNLPTGRDKAAMIVFQISIVSMFIGFICVPYDALIVAHEKMKAFAYFGIFEVVAKLLICFLLVIAPFDKLIFYACLLLAIGLLKRAAYSWYTYRMFEESRNVQYKIDRPLFKEMFSFAGWNLFGNGSATLRNQGIDILMNIFFGVVVNAAKAVSNQVLNAVSQFVGNFLTALDPQLTKSIAADNIFRTHQLIKQGTRFSFYLMCFFAVPIIISINEILSLWLVEVPDYATFFVIWTFIYSLGDCLSRLLINAILATGNIRNYQILAGGTKLFALPIAYVWLRLGGSPIVGVWVNILLDFVCLLERLWYTKRRLGINSMEYLITVVLRCWLVFSIALILPYLYYHNITTNLFACIPVSVTSVLIVIALLGLNKTERKMILSKSRSLINRLKK